MHPLLRRQLKKLGLTPEAPPAPDAWRAFCDRVDQAYREADQDRYLLERSLRISSDEMRELYERLKSSTQARVRAIARAVPDMLFFQDEEGVFLEVITAHPEQLYAPAEAVIGKRPEEIFEPQDAERFMNLLRATLESGEEQTLEYWLEVPGGRRQFEARCVPVDYQVEGRRTLLTVVHDITERRQEETWNRLVGRAVSSAQEGILILDEARRIRFANPAWHRLVAGDDPSLPACIVENLRLWRKVEEQGGWREEVAVPGETERWWWVRVDKVKLEADQCTYYVVLVNDVTELHASRRELEYLATHDALTGLPNRVLFRDRLGQALARARREGRGGAVLFIDLDRFKGVNDTLGHRAGDRLLAEVARRLRRAVREVDTLARLGGDEFILLVEEVTHRRQLAPVLEKLMGAFHEPFHIEGKEFRISASVGVGLFPEDGDAVDPLLQHADAAMYSAKSAGGARSRFFSRELASGAGRAFELEQSLRRALAGNELYLVYQPQYRIGSGRFAGLEVLLRWRSEQWGEMEPARFIPVAEASGFMDELGSWVMEAACRQYREWHRQGLEVPRLAINLSACELRQPWLAERVRELLLDHGVPFERIEFEITESMILGEEEDSHRNLMELHRLGIGLAIDDFGTGHSTLANLKRFPLDCLKIDASFVRDVGRDRNDEAIIRASVALARSFGMRTVAEGVEERAQYEFLRRCGCDEVQGFLCARPMTAGELEERLTRGSASCDCEKRF